jgi:hypothetical protein
VLGFVLDLRSMRFWSYRTVTRTSPLGVLAREGVPMGLRPIQEAMYRWWSLPPAFFSAGPTGHKIADATYC